MPTTELTEEDLPDGKIDIPHDACKNRTCSVRI